MTPDDVMHRDVAVKLATPTGRWVCRSWVVDIATDASGEVLDVEVAAAEGCLFPLAAVTFLDGEEGLRP